MQNRDDGDPDDRVCREYDSSEAEVGRYAERYERAEVLSEVRVAEKQIASGDGIEHDEAKRQVLARLRKK